MIWMTWRQFRTQAVTAAVLLAVLAIYLVILGSDIRDTLSGRLALCRGQGGCPAVMAAFKQEYSSRLYLLDALLIAAPGVLGIFWGAPLVARELEAGTHRLVWNQSVTRRRWLAVKLLLGGLATVAVTGLFSALLTWAASPYDHVAGDRFTALLFGTRNIAPLAYAAFAFVLGAVLGLTIRRTLPAMALTVLVFALVQIAVPAAVRPHLTAPVTVSQPMTAEAIRSLSFLGSDAGVSGLRIPGAWVVSTSGMLTADGRPVDLRRYNDCVTGNPDPDARCLAALDLHVEAAYQPAGRYWYFQWLESAIFLALGGLLAAFGLWRIQRRPA